MSRLNLLDHNIKYMGIDMKSHYDERGVFGAVKLLQKIMIQYAASGVVNFKNSTLHSEFGMTRRGIQKCMVLLEKDGIAKREFEDESKYVRLGFTIDVEKAIKWLSSTSKDVNELPRGTLYKHFVMQSVIYAKPQAKALKKDVSRRKYLEQKERIEQKIAKHVEKRLKRRIQFLNRLEKAVQVENDDVLAEIKKQAYKVVEKWIYNTLKYSPPEVIIN